MGKENLSFSGNNESIASQEPPIDYVAMALAKEREMNERVPERTQTVERLTEVFGDKKFSYVLANGTVKFGTFSEMLAVCPAFDAAIDSGFEAAASMISGYEISDAEYDRLVNQAQPTNEEEPTPDETDEEVDEVTAKGESAKPIAKDEINTVADKTVVENQPEVIEPTPLFSAEQQMPIVDGADAAELVGEDQQSMVHQEVIVEHVADGGYRADTIEKIDVIMPVETKNEMAVESSGDSDGIVPEVVSERVGEIQVKGSEIIEEVVLENDTTPLPVPVDKLPATYDTFLEPPEYTSRENAVELADNKNTDISAFQLPIIEAVPIEDELQPTQEFTVGEMDDFVFDADKLVAQEDFPAGEAENVSSVDFYNQEVEVPSAEPSAVVETESVVPVVETTANAQPAEVFVRENEVEVIEPETVQKEMIADTVSELIGEEASEKYDYTLPEVQKQAEEIIKKAALLEQATSAEECQERLLEIRIELVALLTLLGYEDVERTAEKLTADLRDIEKIKRYMAMLLRAALQKEVTKTRAQVHAQTHPQRHRFGQWVVGMMTGGVKLPQAA